MYSLQLCLCGIASTLATTSLQQYSLAILLLYEFFRIQFTAQCTFHFIFKWEWKKKIHFYGTTEWVSVGMAGVGTIIRWKWVECATSRVVHVHELTLSSCAHMFVAPPGQGFVDELVDVRNCAPQLQFDYIASASRFNELTRMRSFGKTGKRNVLLHLPYDVQWLSHWLR